MFVQFSDESKTVIVSYFASPQDPSHYLNYGDIELDDPRWGEFYKTMSPVIDDLPEPTIA